MSMTMTVDKPGWMLTDPALAATLARIEAKVDGLVSKALVSGHTLRVSIDLPRAVDEAEAVRLATVATEAVGREMSSVPAADREEVRRLTARLAAEVRKGSMVVLP